MDTETHGSVSIIDFEGVDLDSPCVIRPTALNRVSWEKMLSITLDDLSDRIAPKYIVVCEGSSVGNRRKDFDAEIYNHILGSHTPDVVFVSGESSSEIERTGNSIRRILSSILPTSKVTVLTDRDEKSPREVEEWENRGGVVLQERNLESYLLADDVIDALVEQVGKLHLRGDAIIKKREALAQTFAQGKPRDDLKSAAGLIFNGLKSLLELERAGSNSDEFMRTTLAPLIVPGMSTYNKLRSEIIDRIK